MSKLSRCRFKGRYGSSANDTVHGVQMDNLVHKDNTGWYRGMSALSKIVLK